MAIESSAPGQQGPPHASEVERPVPVGRITGSLRWALGFACLGLLSVVVVLYDLAVVGAPPLRETTGSATYLGDGRFRESIAIAVEYESRATAIEFVPERYPDQFSGPVVIKTRTRYFRERIYSIASANEPDRPFYVERTPDVSMVGLLGLAGVLVFGLAAATQLTRAPRVSRTESRAVGAGPGPAATGARSATAPPPPPVEARRTLLSSGAGGAASGSRLASAETVACAHCGAPVSPRVIACPNCGTPVGYRGGTALDRQPAPPRARLPAREDRALPASGSGGPNYSYRKAAVLAALSLLFLQGVLYDLDLAWTTAPQSFDGVVVAPRVSPQTRLLLERGFTLQTATPVARSDPGWLDIEVDLPRGVGGPRGEFRLRQGVEAPAAGGEVTVFVHSRYWEPHVLRVVGPPPAHQTLWEERPHQVSAPGIMWETGTVVCGGWAIAQTWIAYRQRRRYRELVAAGLAPPR